VAHVQGSLKFEGRDMETVGSLYAFSTRFDVGLVGTGLDGVTIQVVYDGGPLK